MMTVADTLPRPDGLSGQQAQHLVALAALAVNELELRLQQRIAQEAAARAIAEAKAADAARSAEARLRKAQEAAGAVAFDLGPGGEVLGAVVRLGDLLGLSRGVSLTRRTVALALRPKDRALFEIEADRIAHVGGSFRLEVGVEPVNGSETAPRWLEVRGAAEPPQHTSAGHGRVLGVVLDVTARRMAEEALRRSEAWLRMAQEAAQVGVWEWRPDDGTMVWTPELRSLLALKPEGAGPAATLETFLNATHPEDRLRLREAMQAATEMPTGFDEEFRILLPKPPTSDIDPEGPIVRWLLYRARRAAVPDDAGGVRLLGACIDVTARRASAARERLLTREVDHRARNALAVIQAALRLTRAQSVAEYARVIEGRVATLARVQTLLTKNRWTTLDFHALARGELVRYLPLITFDGPRVAIVPTAAQPLGLVFHELTTNAVKHGALSADEGRVSVQWRTANDGLHLIWTESGGSHVLAPKQRGFGMRMIETSVNAQLGGKVVWRWSPEGLTCEISVPTPRALDGVATQT